MAQLKGLWLMNEKLDLSDTTVFSTVEAGDIYLHTLQFSRVTPTNKKWASIGMRCYDYSGMPALIFQHPYPATGSTPAGEIVYLDGSDFITYWRTDSTGSSLYYRTLDFGAAEQTVDDAFYNWLCANAAEQSASGTSGAAIVYNGGEPVELTAGQKATLHCAGMQMAGDVTVTCG